MKNTFGSSITLTLFGESHGEAIGAVLDGLAPGIAVDLGYINKKLDERRPDGNLSTKRVEEDAVRIVSGVFEGFTTGTPLTLLIFNSQQKSGDYSRLKEIPRPSHADFTASVKYRGFQDYRGGGHFSGRITAALTAAGALLQSALEQKQIFIGTHIASLHGVSDRPFSDLKEDFSRLSGLSFPVLDETASNAMKQEILNASAEGDSVGGILESGVIGLSAGIGEPWFDTLEGLLAHALFSIPAVKGVEFGEGFGFASLFGSEANDNFETNGGRTVTSTNHNGGINGGISNGMPILFRTAVKPTPSIYKPQHSVRLSDGSPVELQITGRHDPAIIHRARPVVDAVTALVIADCLAQRFGTDWLTVG